MRPSRTLTFSVFVLVALTALAPAAGALGMYASSTSGSTGPSSLYRLRFYDGLATLVGPIYFNRVSAMDAEPINGILYACAQRPDTNVPVLISINVRTGVGVEVGPTGIAGSISDMSFRPADGKLFAHDATPGNHRLYTINTTTGAATLVGPTGVGGQGNAIEFQSDNVLYLHTDTHVYRLDQNTGAATQIAPMTYTPPLSPNPRPTAMDLRFDGTQFAVLVNPGAGNTVYGNMTPVGGFFYQDGDTGFPDLDAIAFVSRPTGWMTNGAGGGASGLYRFDVATASPTFIGGVGFDHVGGIDNLTYGPLFGVGNLPGTTTPVLLTIDPVTGRGYEVGPTGVDPHISDLSWRSSHGIPSPILYGYNAANDPDHSLYRFDTVTGAATLVGNTGITSQGGNGIAISPTNITLWHASTSALNTLNLISGVATFQSGVGFPPPFDAAARPPAMDYDWNGSLLAIVNDFSGSHLARFDHFSHNFLQIGHTGLAGVEALSVRLDQNPQTMVIGPNGGESFLEGSTQTITWDTFNDLTIRSVNIGVNTAMVLVAGTSGTPGSQGTSDADMYEVNQSTGATFNTGTITGYSHLGAMSMNPSTGDLFACANRTSDGTPVLITIVGGGYEVGPTGIPNGSISDIAWRTSDNELFAYDAFNHNLYRLNPHTGRGILVGPSGLVGNGGNGIAFHDDGTLYHANRTHLSVLNPATGAMVSQIPLNFLPPLNGLSWNPAALEFDPQSGQLYAILKPFGVADPAHLAIIDVATGNVSDVGSTGVPALDGLAFVLQGGGIIAFDEPNDGSYTWTVPNTPTKVARIYITVEDDASQFGFDWSNGYFSITSAVSADLPGLPSGAYLSALSPNPFRANAPIRFGLAQAGSVKLTVHDVRGGLARTLVYGMQPAGAHAVPWDGEGQSGGALAAGVYFVRLEVDGKQVSTRRAVLLH